MSRFHEQSPSSVFDPNLLEARLQSLNNNDQARQQEFEDAVFETYFILKTEGMWSIYKKYNLI